MYMYGRWREWRGDTHVALGTKVGVCVSELPMLYSLFGLCLASNKHTQVYSVYTYVYVRGLRVL